MISFEIDTRAFERALTDLERNQLPFAISRALNDTAEDVKQAWEGDILRRLDRPTPFTQRAVFIQRSTKSRLVAVVGIKDTQAEYLRWQVTGGTQSARRRAIPLPAGQRRNRYGNAPRGAIKRALSKPNTFSGTVRGVSGIWQRMRSKSRPLKLLFAYEPRTTYSARLNLERPALSTARRVAQGHLARRVAEALATAR